jgi:homoserine dehydrogenase
MGDAQTRYHISLDVEDRSGVLAQVAAVFADHDVSIETVRQQLVPAGDGKGARANLIIVTHTASDEALSSTVERLRTLDVVRGVNSVMRVEGS